MSYPKKRISGYFKPTTPQIIPPATGFATSHPSPWTLSNWVLNIFAVYVKPQATEALKTPRPRYSGSSTSGDFRAYSPTVTADSPPRIYSATNWLITDAIRTAVIPVFELKNAVFSSGCTISRAKNTPAKGALKPALTPDAAPALNKSFCYSSVNLFEKRRLVWSPISTDGPSGPNELPVPNVAIDAKNFAKYFSSFKSFNSFSSLTIPGSPGVY